MAKLECKVELAGVPGVKELLAVLVNNYDGLPEQVQNAMHKLADGAELVWDSDYFWSIGVDPSELEAFVDGVKTDKVISAHPCRRQVLLHGKGFVHADRLEICKVGGEPVMGWK